MGSGGEAESRKQLPHPAIRSSITVWSLPIEKVNQSDRATASVRRVGRFRRQPNQPTENKGILHKKAMSTIREPRLHALCKAAQELPKWATLRLWSYILSRTAFATDEWTVSAMQPPTHRPGEDRLVDLVVEKLVDSGSSTPALFVMLAGGGGRRGREGPDRVQRLRGRGRPRHEAAR